MGTQVSSMRSSTSQSGDPTERAVIDSSGTLVDRKRSLVQLLRL